MLQSIIFPQDLDKDRLFIVTAKNNAMILEAQGTGPNLEIITKARGDVGDRIGQNAQTGTRYSQIIIFLQNIPHFLCDFTKYFSF